MSDFLGYKFRTKFVYFSCFVEALTIGVIRFRECKNENFAFIFFMRKHVGKTPDMQC